MLSDLEFGEYQEDLIIDTGGYDLHLSNVTLAYSSSRPASLFIYANTNESVKDDKNQTLLPQIELVKTTLRFQMIYMETHQIIMLDKDSVLDANGTGSVEGLGWNLFETDQRTKDAKIEGGAFGGQGGNCDNLASDTSYGHYFQEFELSKDELIRQLNASTYDISQYVGSGGGLTTGAAVTTQGGGAIVLRSGQFKLLGKIGASGYPLEISNSTFEEAEIVSGGSGGYILIDQIAKYSQAS